MATSEIEDLQIGEEEYRELRIYAEGIHDEIVAAVPTGFNLLIKNVESFGPFLVLVAVAKTASWMIVCGDQFMTFFTVWMVLALVGLMGAPWLFWLTQREIGECGLHDHQIRELKEEVKALATRFSYHTAGAMRLKFMAEMLLAYIDDFSGPQTPPAFYASEIFWQMMLSAALSLQLLLAMAVGAYETCLR